MRSVKPRAKNQQSATQKKSKKSKIKLEQTHKEKRYNNKQ